MFAGLCDNCKHVQVIKSAKGSVFHLCMYSKIDSRFSKYPRLPVFGCPAYQTNDEAGEAAPHHSGTRPK